MRTAIDTNVISALWSNEPASANVANLLFEAKKIGGLVISAPVYVELLAYPNATKDFLDKFLQDSGIEVDFVLTEEVWQKAALSFANYANRRRNSKSSHPKRLLVDFIVGAHALLEANRLMTMDKNRYITAFADLEIVR